MKGEGGGTKCRRPPAEPERDSECVQAEGGTQVQQYVAEMPRCSIQPEDRVAQRIGTARQWPVEPCDQVWETGSRHDWFGEYACNVPTSSRCEPMYHRLQAETDKLRA